jgi:hypothetical protein
MSVAGLTRMVNGGKASRATVMVPARGSLPTSSPRIASAAEALAAALAAPDDPDGGGVEVGGLGVLDVPLPEGVPVGGFVLPAELELPVEFVLPPGLVVPLELGVPEELELPEAPELDDELVLPVELELPDEVEFPAEPVPPVVVPPVVVPPVGAGLGAFGLWTRVCAAIGPAHRAKETAITPHHGPRPSDRSVPSTRAGAQARAAVLLCSLKIRFIISPRGWQNRSSLNWPVLLQASGIRKSRRTHHQELPPS